MTNEQTNNQLLYGKDARVYVNKVMGDPSRPVFSVILPAAEADLPPNRVAGPSLTLGPGFTKISMRNMLFVHAYFKAIYDQFKAEAIVFFHKNQNDDDYVVVVPESFSATAASLVYEHVQPKYCTLCRICSTNAGITTCPRCGTDTMEPTNIYGTAHSHGSMSAFHSGTDDEHEKGQTGFHITFGNVDKGMFSVCPSFVTALVGYTTDGKGIRHYPQLEELVDLPSPLTQADRQTIATWCSTILNEAIAKKLSSDFVVIIDKNTKAVVYHGANSSAVERWIAAQGSHRELQIAPISALLNNRTQNNRRSSTPGVVTTRQPHRHSALMSTVPAIMGNTVDTNMMNGPMSAVKPAHPMPLTTATATNPTSTGISTSSTNILAGNCVWDLERFTVTVDPDYDGTVVEERGTDKEYSPWRLLEEAANPEYAVLQLWELIYIMQEISTLIRKVVPYKTAGIDNSIDTALKDLAKSIDQVFGDGTAAQSIVDGYTDDGEDITDIVKKSIDCVMREIEGAVYRTDNPLSILKSIGSLFLINFLVEEALFWGLSHKLINEDICDSLNEKCVKVAELLLEQQAKEVADSLEAETT